MYFVPASYCYCIITSYCHCIILCNVYVYICLFVSVIQKFLGLGPGTQNVSLSSKLSGVVSMEL